MPGSFSAPSAIGPRVSERLELPRSSTRAAEDISEFRFDDTVLGIEHFRPGDDHDVQPWRNVGFPEHLADEPFRPVPHDRAPQFPRSGNTETADWPPGSEHHHGHQPGAHPLASLIDALELRPAPDMPVSREGFASLLAHLASPRSGVRRFVVRLACSGAHLG
jgi:hypothetical protein